MKEASNDETLTTSETLSNNEYELIGKRNDQSGGARQNFGKIVSGIDCGWLYGPWANNRLSVWRCQLRETGAKPARSHKNRSVHKFPIRMTTPNYRLSSAILELQIVRKLYLFMRKNIPPDFVPKISMLLPPAHLAFDTLINALQHCYLIATWAERKRKNVMFQIPLSLEPHSISPLERILLNLIS